MFTIIHPLFLNPWDFIKVRSTEAISSPKLYFVFLFLGQLIGDCVDDQFSISGGLSGGTPTICGTNTGYHSKSETILLTSPSTVAKFDIKFLPQISTRH